MTVQIRVSSEAHQKLARDSEKTGVPITKLVDRLIKVRVKRAKRLRIPILGTATEQNGEVVVKSAGKTG